MFGVMPILYHTLSGLYCSGNSAFDNVSRRLFGFFSCVGYCLNWIGAASQPGLEIIGVARDIVSGEAEVLRQDHGSGLGDQFLASVVLIAPPWSRAAVQPMWRGTPVYQLVQQGQVERLSC